MKSNGTSRLFYIVGDLVHKAGGPGKNLEKHLQLLKGIKVKSLNTVFALLVLYFYFRSKPYLQILYLILSV